MGRRSFGISATQINRMVSAYRSAKHYKEREELIENQKGISTKKKPSYEISNFDFKETSRIAHIEFIETTYYRKIQRYVTQNGVRHPIYSDWLCKTKTIKKVIKLTNENLERLNSFDDKLIAKFSTDIVSMLDNVDLYPSWFIIGLIKKEQEKETRDIADKYNNKITFLNKDIKKHSDEIKDCEKKINQYKNETERLIRKKVSKQRNLNFAKNKSHYIIFSILTFGIWCIFHSKRLINKLISIIDLLEKEIIKNNSLIEMEENMCAELNKKINEYSAVINNEIKERDEMIEQVNLKYKSKIQEVEPLLVSTTDITNKDFISLKKFCGLNYEKLIGCYVIRNTENGKCYVGQSKDVIKRITKQHFDGTKVKNIIFAEDYFKSNLENKDELFEVKIIKLNTKDELDRTEAELIEEYDSFNNGYNGTAGNK